MPAILILAVFFSATLLAQMPVARAGKATRVPFVGCRSDGQVGPRRAPVGRSKTVAIAAVGAQKFSFYKAATGSGVLAPRGWHCFGTYGSAGNNLFVSPDPIRAVDLFSSTWKGFVGPVVQISGEDGGTSGRFGVAQVIARVFPAHRDFVHSVIEEDKSAGISPPNSYTYSPYPNDKLSYRSNEVVEYETSANSNGLGTDSRLVKNHRAIHGVAILVGQTPDLIYLSMRLPVRFAGLESSVIQQVEYDAASEAPDSQ
jgi:hypothetical protein